MFNIEFKPDVDMKLSLEEVEGIELLERGVPYLRGTEEDGTSIFDSYGEIVVGSHREGFRAPLFFWSKSDYESQWRHALLRLTRGQTEKTALFTKVYNPGSGELFEWWPVYREGDMVYFQNALLPTQSFDGHFDFGNIDKYVPVREVIGADGDHLMEWSISLAELSKSPLLMNWQLLG